MRIKLQIATARAVGDRVSLRIAVNQHLTSRHEEGYGSSGLTEKGVLFAMRTSTAYIARDRNTLIATLKLFTRKPWAIDKKYFNPRERPLYLTAMAVTPDRQRQGIGRLCIEVARRIARKSRRDAIRLDAHDAEAPVQANFTEKAASG